MCRVIPTLLMLLSITFCYSFPASSAQEPQGAEENQFDTSAERLGELRLGLPEKDIAGSISCKQPKKSKDVYEAATGEYVQEWKSTLVAIIPILVLINDFASRLPE